MGNYGGEKEEKGTHHGRNERTRVPEGRLNGKKESLPATAKYTRQKHLIYV